MKVERQLPENFLDICCQQGETVLGFYDMDLFTVFYLNHRVVIILLIIRIKAIEFIIKNCAQLKLFIHIFSTTP